MNDTDCQDITNALLKVICKADEEFQEQLANGIGVSLETFQEYLDKVDFSGVKLLKK
jgi:hypothetical protein